MATAAALGAATGLTPATVNKTLAHLQRLGVVGELTERQRGRVFAYLDYVGLLNAELNADPSATAPTLKCARKKTRRPTSTLEGLTHQHSPVSGPLPHHQRHQHSDLRPLG